MTVLRFLFCQSAKRSVHVTTIQILTRGSKYRELTHISTPSCQQRKKQLTEDLVTLRCTQAQTRHTVCSPSISTKHFCVRQARLRAISSPEIPWPGSLSYYIEQLSLKFESLKHNADVEVIVSVRRQLQL